MGADEGGGGGVRDAESPSFNSPSTSLQRYHQIHVRMCRGVCRD